jgi:hypothetical protein
MCRQITFLVPLGATGGGNSALPVAIELAGCTGVLLRNIFFNWSRTFEFLNAVAASRCKEKLEQGTGKGRNISEILSTVYYCRSRPIPQSFTAPLPRSVHH